MNLTRACTSALPAVMLLICRVGAVGLVTPAAQATLDPATYRSPSGRYELSVDPQTATGAGAGQHRLRRDGVEVWSGEQPYTLHQALVTDDGVVAGYAYEGGVRTVGHHGPRRRGLSVIIIGPDKALRQRDERRWAAGGGRRRGFSGSDSPRISGLVADPAHDRFIVVIPGRYSDAPVWWTYRLGDGARAGDFTLERPVAEPGFAGIVSSHLVPGTDLVLTQWYTSRYGAAATREAALTLVDTGGETIWTERFPDEYDGLGERWEWWDLHDAVPQVDVGERRFGFRSLASHERVTYVVHADAAKEGGWRIVESGRVAIRDPGEGEGAAVADASAPAAIELAFRGTIELRAPEVASPVRRLRDFAVDAGGNVGFVYRGERPGEVRFVHVDREGTVRSDVRLGLPDEADAELPRAVPVDGDRWVAVRSSIAGGGAARTWRFDPETGETERIAASWAAGVKALTPAPDGGFVVLVRHRLEYTMEDEICAYDRRARRRWSRREPGHGQGHSFQAITALPDGRVAGLTAVRKTIELFGPEGNHLASWKIADLIGHEPNYPAGLTADAGGGMILHDFRGSPPVYRIAPDGQVTSRLRPRFDSGKTFRLLYGGVKAAPDGTLWTSDGHALLRLGEGGVVDLVVGRQPDDDALGEVRALTVDGHGSIYALDDRTERVHFFAPDGAPILVCRPDPGDALAESIGASITVDGDGHVYCATGGAIDPFGGGGFLRFDANGRRIGVERLDAVPQARDWLCKPGSRERWVTSLRSVHLVGESGAVQRTIERRPDGAWLDRVGRAAVAPDGSIAVLASKLRQAGDAPMFACVYDGKGEGVTVLSLGPGSRHARIAFDGSTVITCVDDHLDLRPVDGGAARRFDLPDPHDASTPWWTPFVAPDGVEVWVWPRPQAKLLRFALPGRD